MPGEPESRSIPNGLVVTIGFLALFGLAALVSAIFGLGWF